MNWRSMRSVAALIGWWLAAVSLTAAEPSLFLVASYNLENYVDPSNTSRPAKSDASKAKIRESLRAADADVVALQEIGTRAMIEELRLSLKTEGLDYPYSELVGGFDTNIYLGLLSRHPIVRRRPHTDERYLLYGRRFQVSRGFMEVEIEVSPGYRFTLFNAHLKSRRPVPEGDQAEMREQEARILREKIDARLRANPSVNLIVVGDFNDLKNSAAVRRLIGRGRTALFDVRPSERNGDSGHPEGRYDPRTVAWTHYYGVEDTYSRVDYILVSPGMRREWLPDETHVLALPDWGVGSDHRPIVAGFRARDR